MKIGSDNNDEYTLAYMLMTEEMLTLPNIPVDLQVSSGGL